MEKSTKFLGRMQTLDFIISVSQKSLLIRIKLESILVLQKKTLIHSEKVVDNFLRKLRHMIQTQDLRLELHRLPLELRSQDLLLLFP